MARNPFIAICCDKAGAKWVKQVIRGRFLVDNRVLRRYLNGKYHKKTEYQKQEWLCEASKSNAKLIELICIFCCDAFNTILHGVECQERKHEEYF